MGTGTDFDLDDILRKAGLEADDEGGGTSEEEKKKKADEDKALKDAIDKVLGEKAKEDEKKKADAAAAEEAKKKAEEDAKSNPFALPDGSKEDMARYMQDMQAHKDAILDQVESEVPEADDEVKRYVKRLIGNPNVTLPQLKQAYETGLLVTQAKAILYDRQKEAKSGKDDDNPTSGSRQRPDTGGSPAARKGGSGDRLSESEINDVKKIFASVRKTNPDVTYEAVLREYVKNRKENA